MTTDSPIRVEQLRAPGRRLARFVRRRGATIVNAAPLHCNVKARTAFDAHGAPIWKCAGTCGRPLGPRERHAHTAWNAPRARSAPP